MGPVPRSGVCLSPEWLFDLGLFAHPSIQSRAAQLLNETQRPTEADCPAKGLGENVPPFLDLLPNECPCLPGTAWSEILVGGKLSLLS